MATRPAVTSRLNDSCPSVGVPSAEARRHSRPTTGALQTQVCARYLYRYLQHRIAHPTGFDRGRSGDGAVRIIHYGANAAPYKERSDQGRRPFASSGHHQSYQNNGEVCEQRLVNSHDCAQRDMDETFVNPRLRQMSSQPLIRIPTTED
jgi:hypothetical protein